MNNKLMPYNPPNGFVFILPGPTNQMGASLLMSINPLFKINHKPTKPPCSPIQPHKQLSSFNLTKVNNIPSKNSPKRIEVIWKKGKLNPRCTRLNKNA